MTKPSTNSQEVAFKLMGTIFFLTQIIALYEKGVPEGDKGAINLDVKNGFGETVSGKRDIYQFGVPNTEKVVRITMEAFNNVADAPEVKEFELKEEKLPQLTQPNRWRSDGAMAGN